MGPHGSVQSLADVLPRETEDQQQHPQQSAHKQTHGALVPKLPAHAVGEVGQIKEEEEDEDDPNDDRLVGDEEVHHGFLDLEYWKRHPLDFCVVGIELEETPTRFLCCAICFGRDTLSIFVLCEFFWKRHPLDFCVV